MERTADTGISRRIEERGIERMERFTEKLEDGRKVVRDGIAYVENTKYGRFFDGEAVEKLAKYEDAEEQGLLIRLPCNVGDTVYSVSFKKKCPETNENGGYLINQNMDCAFCENKCKSKEEWFIEEITATLPIIANIILEKDKDSDDFMIYLTLEEAERKLKEMEESE